jgi:hypothetical protein
MCVVQSPPRGLSEKEALANLLSVFLRQLLYTIGNKKANEILEGIVQDPTSKPTPSASRADREVRSFSNCYRQLS